MSTSITKLDALRTILSISSQSGLLERNAGVTGWYQNEANDASLSAASLAYHSAVEFFSTELTHDECKRIWLSDKTSLEDVKAAVDDAQKVYESRGRKSKIRQYLAAFSSRVMYYGAVMDTLSQHHPEFVSLAWGAVKFLFVGLLNYEELLTQIAKTLTRIADVLPRSDLTAILYPTERVKEAVAQLYARVIRFIEFAVRWYKKGKIAHSIAAILHPFQISCKDTVENIAECSRRVDSLACAASKAELRDLHITVQHLAEMAISSHLLQTQISLDLRDQKQQSWNYQVSQLLALPSARALPSPSESLQFHLSARNRYRAQQRYSVSYDGLVPVLQSWASGSSSSVLLAQGKNDPKSAKHFAVDVIEIVLTSGVPIVWALLGGAHVGSMSCSDVFRSLAYQALQLSRQGFTTTGPHPTASAVSENATPVEWSKLLDQALLGLPLVYIVIDTELFRGAPVSDRRQASNILRNLAKFSGLGTSKRKVILCSRRAIYATIDHEVLEELAPIQIFTDIDLNRGRSGGRSSARTKDWRSVRLSRGTKGASRIPEVVKSALICPSATT